MHHIHSFLVTLLFLAAVSAAPVAPFNRRASVLAASTSQIASIIPYAHFAAVAYCHDGTPTWNCGPKCKDIPDFQISAAGGDGAATPHWFVGWSPSLNSIIVTHEGTNPTNLLSDLNDLQVVQQAMNQDYFPGVSAGIMVHSGFQDTFERSATPIKTAVTALMANHTTTQVTVIGHSLGGAVSMLTGPYLDIQIPAASVKIVTFGGPRVGNAAYASYMGSFDLTRYTHTQDPIPILPGRAMGYHHPQGEIHQDMIGQWNACPGEDNTNSLCSTGAVPNIFLSDLLDHEGPWNGVLISTLSCGSS